MPGGSVYKDKVHEHPQYNTIHIHEYKYMNITKHKTQKMHEKHIHKTLENTKKT
jgi:hypothetical protein